MITDITLSALVFVHPSSIQRKSAVTPTPVHLPPSLALITLHTLSGLSFIISHFGGVTTTSALTGFPELKKVFYLALDILSTDADASERFVRDLCKEFRNSTSNFCFTCEGLELTRRCGRQLLAAGEEGVRFSKH
jgi:hypothetical protein